MTRCALALAWLLMLLAQPAAAHVTGTGLATLQADGRELRYRLSLAASDLPEAAAREIARAADGDRASAERVAQWLRDGVRITAPDGACQPGRASIQRSATAHDRVVLQLSLRCPQASDEVELHDTLPFGEHWRTIVSALGAGGKSEERIVQHDSGAVRLRFVSGAPQPRGWGDFIGLGIEHIATGIDHLLFLLALLLGVTGLAQALAVVSLFTLAHTLTFALASLRVVALPASLVEPAIALSIAWLAWDSLRERASPRMRYALTFAFGLVHGLGFASALSPLDLQGASLAQALVGFALGVEVGQAAFVATALGALGFIERRGAGRGWRRHGALALIGIGVAWFAVRVVGLA